MNENENDVLYHYCSGETFLNIIKNSTLWLSDLNKSNDSQEFLWFRTIIENKIVAILKKVGDDALNDWYYGCQFRKNFGSESTVHIACFSELSDSLSQWRGYAQDGSGIAIGFSKKLLSTLSAPYNLELSKIVYQDQNIFADQFVIEIIKNMDTKGVSHVALELNENYRIAFSKFKNPSFKEECEWRILLKSIPYENMGIMKVGDFLFSQTQFRYFNGSIISYTEMDFSKVRQELIKEVWIGPKSKISKTDVMNLLCMYGYYEKRMRNFEEPILISTSKSSYR